MHFAQANARLVWDVGIKNLGRQNLHEQFILELSLKCIWPDLSELELDLSRVQG